jgi:hypothetical protein
MNKSLLIFGIVTIVFVSAGIFVFSNVHDVSACPDKKTNAALTTSATPAVSDVNTFLSPSVLQSPSSQPA